MVVSIAPLPRTYHPILIRYTHLIANDIKYLRYLDKSFYFDFSVFQDAGASCIYGRECTGPTLSSRWTGVECETGNGITGARFRTTL